MDLSQEINIDQLGHPPYNDAPYESLVVPLSQIIENQGTLNILTLGHVAHGKSTLVRDITGVRTQKHQSELERNITIHLGYANAKIWQCPATGELKATPSDAPAPINKNGSAYQLKRHISFVDCPGHESLLSTMISGSHNVDVVLLLIAGNDSVIPQPQTAEHLLAITAINKDRNLDNFLILQNKLDLISREDAVTNLGKIQEFIRDSPVEHAPIIPISAQMQVNMESIYDYLVNGVPDALNKRKYNAPAQMTVIRSFNVNKPNTPVTELTGGVVGGSLKQGYLHIGDVVEIRPGIVTRTDGKLFCQPIIAKVTSLYSEKRSLDIAFSGGLIGVGLSIDPGLAVKNHLVGQVLGHIGTLPNIYSDLTCKYHKTKFAEGTNLPKQLKAGERVKICVHSTTVTGTVTVNSIGTETDEKRKTYLIKLDVPVCFNEDDRILVLRQTDRGQWKIDGYISLLGKTEFTNIVYDPDYQKYKADYKRKRIVVMNDIGSPTQLDPTSSITQSPAVKARWEADYYKLLDNIPFKTGREKIKIKLKAPVVRRENKQCILSNYSNYIKEFNFYQGEDESQIPIKQLIDVEDNLYKFLCEELMTSCSVNGEHELVINGKFNGTQIESLLIKYVKEFLVCKNCNMVNSFLFKRNGIRYQQCNYCNSQHAQGT